MCRIILTPFFIIVLAEDTKSRDLLEAPMVMAQATTASRNDHSPEISASGEIPTAKRRNWSEVSGDRIETLNLGPIDSTSILEHLISNVRLEMKERYSSVLEEYDIARILEESLSPSVKEILWGSAVDMKSAFVTLATLNAPIFHSNAADSQPGRDVDVSRIPNTDFPSHRLLVAEKHKRYVAGSTFQRYLASDDSVIRAWAEQTRDAFNDIRNSPDPGIRNYWWDLHKERILKAQDT
ncbi:hypothetical protein N7463_004529 [Penicillium fimorum]|uniref:Uncharacterized protein n=1 Tax=Penicillium fimorum TaxID=1882269 RepID=A0A9W9Y366_9EURO|nr:hypothetical protein N7463_004529 [Penicillium fimorum]